MSPTYIPEGYYDTVPDVAEQQQVTRRTVLQWIAKGWLKSVQTPIGHLIPADQLESLTRPKPGPKPPATD